MGINLNDKYVIDVFFDELFEYKSIGKIIGLLNDDIGIGMFNEINYNIYDNINMLNYSTWGIARYEIISNDKNKGISLYTKTDNTTNDAPEYIKNCRKIYMINPNNSSLWESI